MLPLSIFAGIKSAKKQVRKAIKEEYDCRMTLEEFLKSNMELLNILPKNYRYPLAANFIAEVLENGRADSLKEAYNLYEEQIHRWKMENKMNELIKEQKKYRAIIWYV